MNTSSDLGPVDSKPSVEHRGSRQLLLRVALLASAAVLAQTVPTAASPQPPGPAIAILRSLPKAASSSVLAPLTQGNNNAAGIPGKTPSLENLNRVRGALLCAAQFDGAMYNILALANNGCINIVTFDGSEHGVDGRADGNTIGVDEGKAKNQDDGGFTGLVYHEAQHANDVIAGNYPPAQCRHSEIFQAEIALMCWLCLNVPEKCPSAASSDEARFKCEYERDHPANNGACSHIPCGC